jgi:RNA polymerase sigma-70 factor (ECF subfamily)
MAWPSKTIVRGRVGSHPASLGGSVRPAQPAAAAPPVPEPVEDEELIRAAQDGDLTAFNTLVTRHQRAVFSVCLRLLRDREQAEDATQDTFIRAWQAIDSFRGGMARPWLLRIATNRAYDLLRARARRPADSLDAELYEVEPDWTSQAPPTEHPELFATRAELSGALEAALARLPEDQRLAIILADVQGYGYEEIAGIMGVAVGTVKSRISRGRARLRDMLKENEDGREHFERYIRLSSQAEDA